jgi:hypothetical protein
MAVMPNAENAAAAVATRSWRETPPADASQVVVGPPSGETAAQDVSSIIYYLDFLGMVSLLGFGSDDISFLAVIGTR